ncbi:ABC transporter ATP-binding protein [Pedobacter sp. AW1-32]|uniref:ABC transporter ATP-binding protein n=1 Tax=Pedobacter sp. AW1-32 TaxID=3383026 RepID=UPI003FEF031C
MLTIKNITKQYAGHKALDNVSFNVPPKEIFGLLGPNGAGKTTLLRIINQIIPSDAGMITINEEQLQEKHIRSIGYLPEERGLYKKMGVEEQLLYLCRLRGTRQSDAKNQLDYWLDKLMISHLKQKKLEQLSKGMQQKVQFIAAVLHQPKLIILDEPFTGLDPVASELMKENILELNKSGATVILSTHRMETVEELCCTVVLINKSAKILEGNVNEIREAFKNATYAIQYRGISKGFRANKGIYILSEHFNNDTKSFTMTIKDGYTADQFLRDTLHQNIEVVSFNEVIPSMNEIFINTVNLTN